MQKFYLKFSQDLVNVSYASMSDISTADLRICLFDFFWKRYGVPLPPRNIDFPRISRCLHDPDHLQFEIFALPRNFSKEHIPVPHARHGTTMQILMPFEYHEILEYESRERCFDRTSILYEELIERTWHPSRFERWCLDETEKAENVAMMD